MQDWINGVDRGLNLEDDLFKAIEWTDERLEIDVAFICFDAPVPP